MSLRKLIILVLVTAFLAPGAASLRAQDAADEEGGYSLLDDVSATQVFGPDITADDVRNKVVLFMYWRGEGSISKPTMLRLRGLQKKYYPSGRFMALSSEVRGNRGKTKEVCRQYSINFPVFSELRLPQATYRETPYAVLFDHEGNIVAEGDPNDVFLKIEDTVEDAPAPVSPMLEGVEVTEDSLERRAAKLIPGEGISATMRALERTAASPRESDADVAAEAQAMVDSVYAWINTQIETAKELQGDCPAHALVQLEELKKTVRNMDVADEVDDMIDALEEDRDTKDLAAILEDANTLAGKLWSEGMGSTSKRVAESLRDKIDDFLDRDDLTDTLEDEAKAIRQEIVG